MRHDDKKPGAHLIWELGVFSGKLSIQLQVEPKKGEFTPIEFQSLPNFQIDWESLRYVPYQICPEPPTR